ncbi:MAG: hypothetical protein ACE5QW_02835 [Thermoplasmata archaeon]
MAIIVFLASLVYVTVSSPVTSTSSPPLRVFLTQINPDPGTVVYEVSGTPMSSLSSRLFSAMLLANGELGKASRMDLLEAGTVGNLTYTDHDGKSMRGDILTVSAFLKHHTNWL